MTDEHAKENPQNQQNALLDEAFAVVRVIGYVRESAQREKSWKKEQERTTRKKELFLEIYQKTLGTITLACEKADIDRGTFYKWRAEDFEFRQKLHEIDNMKVDMVEDQLNKLIVSGDGASIRFYLERIADKYKRKSSVEVVTGERTFEDLLLEAAEKEYAKQHGTNQTGDSDTA